MTHTIIFRTTTSSAADIAAHLIICDDSFNPPLSERLAIEDYAAKLERLAVRFEAWSAHELVGLVAIYCNDPDRRTSFVTNVSVAPQYRGRNLARTLMTQGMAHARSIGFSLMELRVSRASEPALRLYSKLGFQQVALCGNDSIMQLPLSDSPSRDGNLQASRQGVPDRP